VAEWNNADIWDVIAAAQPDAPALIQGERVITWRDFSAQADALATAMIAAGVSQQSKVATYLYNDPEYLIATYAAFKAGLAPFNVNYRYGSEELFYLLDNADAEVVVFDAVLAPKLDAIRDRLPKVRLWVSVGDPAPGWTQAFEDIVAETVAGPVCAPWGRSGDDLRAL
jgi:acyl-CoA synthetase (AMP-forming)/AMP-acid ligase II